MAETVSIKPELIRWAIDRSRLPVNDLVQAFPKLDEWRRGERMPTYIQLEKFAKKTMTPFGYFFLDSPPDEKLPIPDFRTVGDVPIQRPSPNLIETIHAMQRRQTWMRENLMDEGEEPLAFVGSAKRVRQIDSLALRISAALELDTGWAEHHRTWEDALRALRNSAERIGILVATSSTVRLNTHRHLDPQEFRGFVLCDDYAPLIFVNGADSKSAQMFTLAHELVHLWIGQDGLFNLIKMMPHDDEIERFCNRVAAEFLVPGRKLSALWTDARNTDKPFHTLARVFKVSPVVVARRALDLKLISKAAFFQFYEQEQQEWRRRRAQEKAKRKSGPNFYDVQDLRLGKRFAYAVVRAGREGRLLYRDAFHLTDLKGTTFDRYASRLMQRMTNEAQ